MPDWQIALAAFHALMALLGLVSVVVTAATSTPPAIVREADCRQLDVETLQPGPCREP